MSQYTPPIKDMHFLLHDVLGFEHDDLDSEITGAILDEAAKLASNVLAPLNSTGDQNGATFEDGTVKTAAGFKDAYEAYRDGGWNAVPFDPAYGGQGLPYALAFAVQEMWQGANMSFGLCPLLNQGAVEAIAHHGSNEQKSYYLPKLIEGTWTGTMNLTEAHAGSDLGLIRTKATDNGNGTYKISGQKIFITYGDHDMAENIIHLVLARIDGAPEGVKGISLFIVPKFMKDGARNPVNCIGLEHKLGIHASPTCTMEFDAAIGTLVGEAGMGLKYMFTMMNNARLSVGLQGVAIAEAAYQHARAFAAERMQGKSFTNGQSVSIDQHTDVQRMLLTMESQIQAGRALTYTAAMALDAGDSAKVDILTPLVKSWCTDMAVEVASLGIQIHGGAGFIEEAGAAQFYRDARILPIYEGTNGIQALDLAFRKILRDKGKSVKNFIDALKQDGEEQGAGKDFAAYFEALENATDALVQAGDAQNMDLVAAMASPYLKAFALITGGALLAKSSAALTGHDKDFAARQRKTAQFYLHNVMPTALGALHAATKGAETIL